MSEKHYLITVFPEIFRRIASAVKGSGRSIAAVIIGYGLFYAVLAFFLGREFYIIQLILSCIAALSLFCMFMPAFNGEELSFKNAKPKMMLIFNSGVSAVLFALAAVFVITAILAAAGVVSVFAFFLNIQLAGTPAAGAFTTFLHGAFIFSSAVSFFLTVFAAAGLADKLDVVAAVENSLSLLSNYKLLILGAAAAITAIAVFAPSFAGGRILFPGSQRVWETALYAVLFAPFCIFLAALYSALAAGKPGSGDVSA